MKRRGFLTLLAAPAIVRASSLMPVRPANRWYITADGLFLPGTQGPYPVGDVGYRRYASYVDDSNYERYTVKNGLWVREVAGVFA